MAGMLNKIYNLTVLKGEEAKDISREARISFSRLSYRLYSILNRLDPVTCTALIRTQYGPESFSFYCAGSGKISAWVLTNPDRRKILYFESWEEACPPRVYFFANQEHEINEPFLEWLERRAKGAPFLKVIPGGQKKFTM